MTMAIKKRNFLYYLIHDRDLYLMVLPGIVLVGVLTYGPMFGVVLAFKDYNILLGIWGSPWADPPWKYFLQFFNDPFFFRVVRNTVLMSFYTLVWGFPIPVIFALLINEIRHQRFKKGVQLITYLPHFISNVVIIGIAMFLLEPRGLINEFIMWLGFPRQLFLANPRFFRTIMITMGKWQHTGWDAIIYLAAIASVSPELYESARIDGATRLQCARYITLPSIMPVIRILLILEIGGLFNVGMESILLMYNPGIYETADVISTYVYRRGLLDMNYNFGTAVGMFNSVINMILIFLANTFSRKVSGEGLW